MAGGVRPERVQEAIRQEVSNIVQFELRDTRLGFVTITNVDLTKDLRFAKIYCSVLENEKKKSTLAALKSAKGYIKSIIGDRIKLRFTPEIVFELDESYDHTRNVQDILNKINAEKKERGDVDKEGNRDNKES